MSNLCTMYHAAHFVIELFLFGQIKYDYMRNLPIIVWTVWCVSKPKHWNLVYSILKYLLFCGYCFKQYPQKSKYFGIRNKLQFERKKNHKTVDAQPYIQNPKYRRGFLWHATVSAHRYPTLYIFLTIRIYSLLNY